MMSFSGNPLDRASEHRTDPAWVRARRPEALILPLWNLKVFVTGAPEAPKAGLLKPGVGEALAASDAPMVFLGLDGKQPLFALDISAAADDPALAGPLAGLGAFREIRDAAFILPEADLAILGQAKALIDWHQRHRFCPNCGALTGMMDGGYRRLCPQCMAEHFPRTDPVVIMLPVFTEPDGQDYCLVGRNVRFPGALYSAFAGFIEPGETIEEAVQRELREEVNVAVSDITYHASQPWPFPSTLMIGCYARALSRDFKIDGEEIEEARWLSKAEARARLAGESSDDIRLPVPIAIAHHLIRDWAAS
jgi:NAD+ diphosphatase